MAGKRGLASDDLRVSKGSGIRPGILQMLFKGGPARQVASADTRMGRSEGVKPGTRRMLFAGGKARSLATEDLRMGAKGEGEDRPGNLEMLADGGEAGDDEYGGPEVSDEEIICAEDVMDAIGGYFGPSPSDSDSKVEKASKDAARKARAKILAQALKAFFMVAG